MRHKAVVLYGPPASGKDTVTAELLRTHPGYEHFRRLKVGNGKSAGYRMAHRGELDALRVAGLVVYENERYGNTYAVDVPGLDAICAEGNFPVVHIGQIAGIGALRRFYPDADWTAVLLWCSRETTRYRLAARGSTDVDSRLAAWDETQSDLAAAGLGEFAAVLRTDIRGIEDVSDTVHRTVIDQRPTRGAFSDSLD